MYLDNKILNSENEDKLYELEEEIYNLKISLVCIIVAVITLALLQFDLFND